LSNTLEGHAAAADDQAEIVRQAYIQFDIDCTISR
jgi:hypothetical protein